MSSDDPKKPLIRLIGEDSLLVEFEPVVSWQVNTKVRRLLYGLKRLSLPGFKLALPAYRSLLIYFDPWTVKPEAFLESIEAASLGLNEVTEAPSRLFKLPTVYGDEHGPDIEHIANFSGITPGQVITLASQLKLPVFFLGYICSQAYLGAIPEELQVPRLPSPRPLVPGGSFGFGGPQANVLAVDSPSGLNYVGRTFVKMFNPAHLPPTAIRPGDYIQCYSCDKKTALEAGKCPMEEFIEPL